MPAVLRLHSWTLEGRQIAAEDSSFLSWVHIWWKRELLTPYSSKKYPWLDSCWLNRGTSPFLSQSHWSREGTP